jgi:hypothetical protein
MASSNITIVNPIYYQDLEDNTFGYADVHIPAIITHLTTTYGTLTVSDLEINQDKLTEAWNPDDPIENLWKHVKIVQAIATQGGEPISNGTTIQLTLLALGKPEYTPTPWKPGTTRTTPNRLGPIFHCISTSTKELAPSTK